jgi:hypothetical protein
MDDNDKDITIIEIGNTILSNCAELFIEQPLILTIKRHLLLLGDSPKINQYLY